MHRCSRCPNFRSHPLALTEHLKVTLAAVAVRVVRADHSLVGLATGLMVMAPVLVAPMAVGLGMAVLVRMGQAWIASGIAVRVVWR